MRDALESEWDGNRDRCAAPGRIFPAAPIHSPTFSISSTRSGFCFCRTRAARATPRRPCAWPGSPSRARFQLGQTRNSSRSTLSAARSSRNAGRSGTAGHRKPLLLCCPTSTPTRCWRSDCRMWARRPSCRLVLPLEAIAVSRRARRSKSSSSRPPFPWWSMRVLAHPSQAAEAMEMGADAVLVNTAIAIAADPRPHGAGVSQGGRSGPRGARDWVNPINSAQHRPQAR